MKRTECGGCLSADLDLVLDLGPSPLADAFPTHPDQDEPRFPLRVLVCQRCWLVQLEEVVPDEVLWSDYGFYSSTSPSLVAYHRQFADLVRARFGERLTVELACNDGSLLGYLPGRRIGVDAAAGPVEAARAKGLDVRHALFGLDVAQELRDELGPVGLVVAQNVAAHVADLRDFLAGVRHLLADDGFAVLEVQSLADLLLGNQFDHVYHEHRFYFSARSLALALWRAGLTPVQIERTPMQGGSLRLTCRLQQRAASTTSVAADLPEHGLASTFDGMQARADYLRSRLLDLLDEELAAGRKVAGYAASAKSTTLLNWCGLGPGVVSHIVDTTPHKIGRFTPGTHIPIVAPGDRPDPDTYLLLAHNYLSRTRTDPFAGRWVVPIPHPVIL